MPLSIAYFNSFRFLGVVGTSSKENTKFKDERCRLIQSFSLVVYCGWVAAKGVLCNHYWFYCSILSKCLYTGNSLAKNMCILQKQILNWENNVVDQDSYILSTYLVTKGLFVRNVTITVPVRSLKCVNGDGHFEGQNGSGYPSCPLKCPSPLTRC